MKKVIYLQYTNPAAYPPLEHSSRIFAQEGWQVLFLGTESLGSNALRFPQNPNITVKKIPFCTPGWQQKLHYIWFCIWAVGWTLLWRPQWIYASDLFSSPVALLLSYIPKLKIIYHEHDTPVIKSQSRFIKLCLSARQILSHQASLCILPNKQRAASFDKTLNRLMPSVCVWNCPSIEDVAEPRSAWTGECLQVLYHGSISPDLLPLSVLDALSQLPNSVKLRVIGYQTNTGEDYVQTMKDKAQVLNLGDRLEFLGAMPRTELLIWCQKSDIGIALIPDRPDNINLHWLAGASNKAFDYLACGLPIVVPQLKDWEETYVESGVGLSANPTCSGSIADALLWYLDNPVRMREMGECGRKKVLEQWNYEEQFSSVLNHMGCE